MPGVPSGESGATDPLSGTTFQLLTAYQNGSPNARERLLARYLPALRRWAHGRLPAGARGLLDTDDLVQVTLIQALPHLGTFVPTRKGAFFAYLRRILWNRILDEIRAGRRRPAEIEIAEDLVDPRPSPIEESMGRDLAAQYEEALKGLTEEQAEAVLLRIELGFTYAEICDATGCSTADAARMLVARGLLRLSERMRAS